LVAKSDEKTFTNESPGTRDGNRHALRGGERQHGI